jgi:hypothetical protein
MRSLETSFIYVSRDRSYSDLISGFGPTGWAPTNDSGRRQEVSIPVKRGTRFSEVSKAGSHINVNSVNLCLSHANQQSAAVTEEPGVVKKCNLAAGGLGKSPGRAIARKTVQHSIQRSQQTGSLLARNPVVGPREHCWMNGVKSVL